MALASELLWKWKFCTELHNAYTIILCLLSTTCPSLRVGTIPFSLDLYHITYCKMQCSSEFAFMCLWTINVGQGMGRNVEGSDQNTIRIYVRNFQISSNTDATQTCSIPSFIQQIFIEHLWCTDTALDPWNISVHKTEQDSSSWGASAEVDWDRCYTVNIISN